MSRIKALAPIVAIMAAMLALTGCEVVGYNTPVVGQNQGAWQTREVIDPVTGDSLLSITTKTRPNSFFGKVLSFFGRPSFSVSCVLAGQHKGKLRATIDWREAIGPPNLKRVVYHRFDGGTVQEHQMQTSPSGRQSTKTVATSYTTDLQNAEVLAVRTVNSGGNPVTLVFGLRGYGSASSAIGECG